MSEFNERIKNFDKIRAYMRDFYVYGFKVRGDYITKSARTYDNERRRIESWLSRYIHWDYSTKGKQVFLSVDSANVAQNPLYAAWKSKSFTDNDIMLHFFLLDLLQGRSAATAEELTNRVSQLFSVVFDTQTVRKKLNEYVCQGLLIPQKDGKALFYRRGDSLEEECKSAYEPLCNAIKLFQETAPFGFVGSTVLDQMRAENDLFRFPHHFIVHTLEDGVLSDLLSAMREHRAISFENTSARSGNVSVVGGVPMKILVSTQTGRRYLCLYRRDRCRFVSLRLDSIRLVETLDVQPGYEELQGKLIPNLEKCWGVSFGNKGRREQVFLKLFIDEKRESHLLDRLKREGRGGEVIKIANDTFLYSGTFFDSNEILPWVKTFTGRILSFDGTNKTVIRKFYCDMDQMAALYAEEGE